ncbi:uncharacterized protein PGTG_20055 [Puccinia graminis f. sp. tritici CRL 75-36-700-3]|uniref:Uncharacterized protein n=1 Tax=Puccinia graminis f. sp. tritici (strain CRL 75-36-700-3 / race SCCL) TaxID=418459 RepID=E3NX73_PUCGT|nr:uncharacterized protein PGTG_20055 [Puccinia graminis f. sp. tritici CRL 75-36-700-3]EFP94172.1 hypothetical protein PGTG_20055 [Puccinia graminis f. sp. tritici CRL 75-36-700-3]
MAISCFPPVERSWELTPKPVKGFGGSTPTLWAIQGLGVGSPLFGSCLTKPLNDLEQIKAQGCQIGFPQKRCLGVRTSRKAKSSKISFLLIPINNDHHKFPE